MHFPLELANLPEDRGCGRHTRTLLFHSSQVFCVCFKKIFDGVRAIDFKSLN